MLNFFKTDNEMIIFFRKGTFYHLEELIRLTANSLFILGSYKCCQIFVAIFKREQCKSKFSRFKIQIFD